MKNVIDICVFVGYNKPIKNCSNSVRIFRHYSEFRVCADSVPEAVVLFAERLPFLSSTEYDLRYARVALCSLVSSCRHFFRDALRGSCVSFHSLSPVKSSDGVNFTVYLVPVVEEREVQNG